jgi:membrane associated rhomboid family serine protease
MTTPLGPESSPEPTPKRSWRNPLGGSGTEPPFDPSSWSGALIVMAVLAAGLWALQIVNSGVDYRLDRFGIRPRSIDGLWGVLVSPFLHNSYGHLLANTGPFVLLGWAILLSGVRVFAVVTVIVVVVGGLLTWLIAPSGLIVGASGLIMGWLGYLIARAVFTRRILWIVVALLVFFFFGTLLGGLLPSLDQGVSWQSHLFGFLAGILVGWLLHPRRRPREVDAARSPA